VAKKEQCIVKYTTVGARIAQYSDYTMSRKTNVLWYDSWPEQEFCSPMHHD